MSDAKYLFIWDKQEHRVVASFHVAPAGTDPRLAPNDVSHPAIPAAAEGSRIEALRREYPLDRYLFGGGYATSLAACVEGFFGLEKDYSHFWQEPMVRDEAAAVAERYLNGVAGRRRRRLPTSKLGTTCGDRATGWRFPAGLDRRVERAT